MTTKGAESKCFFMFSAVILLMPLHMVEMHEVLHHASNFTLESTVTHELQHQIRQKRDVKGGTAVYVAVIELMVPAQAISKAAIKSYIDSAPKDLNTSVITSINITAECQSSGTTNWCVCEDQYVWTYNICLTYTPCWSLTMGTCDCIRGIPNEGEMCIQKSELPSFDFTIQIETNIDSSLMQIAKNYVQSLTSLHMADSIMALSKFNFTTACLSYNSGYQCKCEDQYFWPCNKCVSQSCDAITNSTCGCINGFPTDGQFCQPLTEITNNPCDPVITTLGPITTPPSTTTKGPITPAPSTTTKGPIAPAPRNTIKLSMVIDEQFDYTLTDITSQKYSTYSRDIISSVDSVYQNKLSSYTPGSVTLTRFRSGSVITDFTVLSTSTTLDFSAANTELASVLSSKGYKVSADSFAQTEEGGLYDQSKGNVYPGNDVVLTCKPPDQNIVSITWMLNNKDIASSSKYIIDKVDKTLTVKNTNNDDTGTYMCKMTYNSIPYKILQVITIQLPPIINVNSSKTLKCDGSPIDLLCCAGIAYTSEWTMVAANGSELPTGPNTDCSTYSYTGINQDVCKNTDQTVNFNCIIRDPSKKMYDSKRVTIKVTSQVSNCFNFQFGAGNLSESQTGACGNDSVGSVTAICQFDPQKKKFDWVIQEDKCVLRVLQDLLDRAQRLTPEGVKPFMVDVQNATASNADKITGSTANTVTVVELLKITANVSSSINIDQGIMTNFLKTLDIIGSINAQATWLALNKRNTTQKTSSDLLKSTEDMGRILTNENFGISTTSTQLNRTITNGPFFGAFGINSTTQINIPQFNGQASITTIVFSAFDKVLPFRNVTYNESNTSGVIINGDVAAIIVNNTLYNISLTFDIKNTSLGNPQCVFWNFSLLDGIGGWDSTGCELKPLENHTDKFTCECNHTTSFSILMSPFYVDNLALAFITFICVGISMICLILSLIIEIIVWRPLTRNDTAYMRHISIVNIALSLLIADICFIIGAALVKKGEPTPLGPCSTATFFMHFFYLALFFWMLFSALLLLYRTVMVFSGMSKAKMMFIAFTLGYGAPLLIAVITVAVTAGGGGYVQEENACWLNWNKTKALLAFVIPALTIVAINFLVLIVVLCKMIRRGVGATTQPDEKHAIVVIARCVAILTPLFGLTWGFGIGTMVTSALGIHIVFAILNSLQGFFIFVFGILLDSKIREELAGKLSLKNFSSSGTRTTSAGTSSSNGLGFFKRKRRRNGYNMSDGSGFPLNSSSNN